MTKRVEDKIIHVETKDGREHYTFNFSTPNKINEDNGEIYGGLKLRDELVYLIAEQFKWGIIKFAYNLDMKKDEDALIFMQKIYPDNFENMTLEEFKALDISELK